jgi:hypothetical protein
MTYMLTGNSGGRKAHRPLTANVGQKSGSHLGPHPDRYPNRHRIIFQRTMEISRKCEKPSSAPAVLLLLTSSETHVTITC